MTAPSQTHLGTAENVLEWQIFENKTKDVVIELVSRQGHGVGFDSSETKLLALLQRLCATDSLAKSLYTTNIKQMRLHLADKLFGGTKVNQ